MSDDSPHSWSTRAASIVRIAFGRTPCRLMSRGRLPPAGHPGLASRPTPVRSRWYQMLAATTMRVHRDSIRHAPYGRTLRSKASLDYNGAMHFTLDGERFELTAQLVRARLQDHVPETIQEYWVDIAGLQWPVKQVIAIATGAQRTRFQSQDARRWLQNLGFVIGKAAAEPPFPRTTTAAARSALGARRGFDASELEALDTVEVTARFTWLRAGGLSLDHTGVPVFPLLPTRPGLYRFDFGLDDEGVRILYVGESVSLRQRASNYRNAKIDRSRQRTSRRIHKEVVAHLSSGGAIEFAIAIEVLLGSDGRALDLRLRSARRLAENAAVLSAQLEEGVAVLNIDADLSDDDEADE